LGDSVFRQGLSVRWVSSIKYQVKATLMFSIFT